MARTMIRGRGSGRGSGRVSVAVRGRGRGDGADPAPSTEAGPSTDAGATRPRPTASVRRDAAAARASHSEGIPHTEEAAVVAEEIAAPARSFPGGPEDTSILRSFGDHVATRIWIGEVIIYLPLYFDKILRNVT